ncbi:MAG: membrane protein insertion efficiency factor YidD [Clostridia bacterium]|nr:membrane protein insertion efficiency factor YidD [Clostridia bacterium]
MNKILKSSFTFILKLPIYFYKGVVSPFLPHSCKFYPSCSSYFIGALNEFGFKGVAVGIKRILRCRPLSKVYGYDPVPINIKGESKWLF